MILPMENTERCVFAGTGKYDIPVIQPETDIRIDKLEWIPVNYALTAKDKATKGVHFYKDDYQFERFWNWDKVQSISGQTYNMRAEAKAHGLTWDGATKSWRRKK